MFLTVKGKGNTLIGREEKGMEELKALEGVCRPIVDYLRQNYDPYTRVSISQDRIIMTQDTAGIPLEKAANHED